LYHNPKKGIRQPTHTREREREREKAVPSKKTIAEHHVARAVLVRDTNSLTHATIGEPVDYSSLL
jgi:hypothetical protein